MWKLFNIHKSDPAFYLKVKTKTTPKGKSYTISVTNYVKLWSGVFDDNSITNIMLESNKGVECNDIQEFLKKGLDMLNNPEVDDKNEFKELDNGDLSIKLICFSPIILKMLFTLNVCTADEYFYAITRPLLLIINDQMNSENQLRHLLFKKDDEIQGYLDTLPDGSTLMRCLKTNVYNDKKHMKNYSAMSFLWGTDPDLGVNPGRILCGKPLPNNNVKAETSGTTPVIKVEPNSDGSGPSQVLPLPTITNTSVQISAVENEPNDGINDPDVSAVKREPNDVKCEPNDGKSEQDDGSTVSGLDDDNQPQTDAANETSTQSPGQNADSIKQPTASGVTEQSGELDHTLVDQDAIPNATLIPKAEPYSQGMQNSIPIKRRKNLNY